MRHPWLRPRGMLLCVAPLAFQAPLEDPIRIRADGPPALERLLRRWDELPEGSEKTGLERTIDAVAAQRHATSSRLYWYTDLDSAVAAARASGRPILSLRLLGRLDEDLSCANSRLFRVVLYANADLSAFLCERFVLHWSSERPAPRLTVDFGDGRTIRTTIAGNSAHFVLDADGRPLELLPGLYSPVAFRRELEAVLPLALESPLLDEATRLRRLRDHHGERAQAVEALWESPAKAFPVPTAPGLLEAERLTVSKMMIEVPAVVRGGLGGRRGLSFGNLYVRRLEEAALDASSRRLVRRLEPTDWERDPRPLDAAGLAAEIALLEAFVAADTERNERELHAAVHAWFESAEEPLRFAELNERLYRELFRTPVGDPWLGFATPLVFTGLFRDGIE